MGLGAPNTNSIPNKKGLIFMFITVSDKLIITPSHLWRNTERHVLNNTIVNKGKPRSSQPFEEQSYALYHQNDYAPSLMHNEALAF